MHKEYAIDPNILISFDRIRAILGTCGWHKGKVVCEYPKKWKRKVYDACNSVGEREKARITELLNIHPFCRRKDANHYDPDNAWLISAKTEHARKTFAAILSDTSETSSNVIDGQIITEDNEPLWAPPSGISPRTANDFAAAISLLAQNSSRIIFVDPHFHYGEQRYTTPFSEMLKVAVLAGYKRSDGEPTFELHMRIKKSYQDTRTFPDIASAVRRGLESNLPQHIPQGITMKVFFWKEHDTATADSERLHNRYFLTDIGGLSFGIGLDAANSNSTGTNENDDISILTKEQHQKHLSEYCCGSKCFESLGDFEITGTLTV
jgi:hypothetical protein